MAVNRDYNCSECIKTPYSPFLRSVPLHYASVDTIACTRAWIKTNITHPQGSYRTQRHKIGRNITTGPTRAKWRQLIGNSEGDERHWAHWQSVVDKYWPRASQVSASQTIEANNWRRLTGRKTGWQTLEIALEKNKEMQRGGGSLHISVRNAWKVRPNVRKSSKESTDRV